MWVLSWTICCQGLNWSLHGHATLLFDFPVTGSSDGETTLAVSGTGGVAPAATHTSEQASADIDNNSEASTVGYGADGHDVAAFIKKYTCAVCMKPPTFGQAELLDVSLNTTDMAVHCIPYAGIYVVCHNCGDLAQGTCLISEAGEMINLLSFIVENDFTWICGTCEYKVAWCWYVWFGCFSRDPSLYGYMHSQSEPVLQIVTLIQALLGRNHRQKDHCWRKVAFFSLCQNQLCAGCQ